MVGYSVGCGNFHFIAAELAIERAVEIEKTLNPYDGNNYIAICCSAIITAYCGFEAKIEEKIGSIVTAYVLGNMNNELISFLNEIYSREKAIGKKLKTIIDKYKKISKLFNLSVSCKEYYDIAFIRDVRNRLVHPKMYSKMIYGNGNESTYGIGIDDIFKVIKRYLHHPDVKEFKSPFDKNNADHFPHLIANALFAQWCLDTIKKFIKNSTVEANSIRDYFPHPCKT
jgi:hypothetical protein